MGFVPVFILLFYAFLTAFLLYLVGVYNGLCYYKRNIKNKYKIIDECITNISNLTTKIVDLTEGLYPKEKIKDVKEINKTIETIQDENEKMHKTKGLILFLNFVNKNINDKKIKPYEKEVIRNLDKIEYAQSFYNDAVDEYNNYKKQIFHKMMSKLFRFKTYNHCDIISNDN